jgi:hypothetical protein
MKAAILSLAFVLCAIVSAIPAVQAVPEQAARDRSRGTIDCGYCTGMLDFCFKVSHDVIKLC